MSWESYVTGMEGEGCQYSGFFDQQGNKWAESKQACLKIEPAQVDYLVKALKSSSVHSGQSVMLGGRKFLLVDKTDETAVMKQLGGGEGQQPQEKLMVCMSMFKTGVCVGAACGEKEKSSRASAEKYANYLKENNL